MQKGKDLFKISFRAADPAITKVLHFHNRHTGFASETFDEISLTCSDWAAEQIAHRHRRKIVLLPESNVLTNPLFHGIVTVDVVERSSWLEEFDQSLRILLDEIL